MASIYLESSVISYHVSRPSRDVVVSAHQLITHEWWERRLPKFDVFVSEVVQAEIQAGDPEAARKRIESITSFSTLELTKRVETLASTYLDEGMLPEGAYRDALHLSLASLHALDYLVTWNCRHVANAEVRRKLADINVMKGVYVPIVCTPEELM